MKHRLPFEILFEDRDLIVIDKPAGLLTTHTHLAGRAAREAQLTAENLLNDYVRKGQLKSSKRVYLVHRLDRETSGVMMFAKSEEVADFLRGHWGEMTEKRYLARVVGTLEKPSGVYESYLQEDADGYRVRSVRSGGKLARTEWKRLRSEVEVDSGTCHCQPQPSTSTSSSSTSTFSLVSVTLHTGRKNQIRVHFAEAGHPVVGDVKYHGPKADRLYLHSSELKVRHPHTGAWLTFTSKAPF